MTTTFKHRATVYIDEANWQAVRNWLNAHGYEIGQGVYVSEDTSEEILVDTTKLWSAPITDELMSVLVGDNTPDVDGYTQAQQDAERAKLTIEALSWSPSGNNAGIDIAIWAPDKDTLKAFGINRGLFIQGQGAADGVAYIKSADNIANGILYFLRLFRSQWDINTVKQYIKTHGQQGTMAGITYWQLDGCRLFEKDSVTSYLDDNEIEYNDWQ